MCNMAHDSSVDENFQNWMRWVFGRIFGAGWYWAAMTLQGELFTAWQERQAEKRLCKSSSEFPEFGAAAVA